MGLETSFEEVLDFETEDVIEFHLVFWEDTNSDQSTEKSVTFEQSLWVFFFKSKKGTGNFSDLGDGQFDSPDFTLVTKVYVIKTVKFRKFGLTGDRIHRPISILGQDEPFRSIVMG